MFDEKTLLILGAGASFDSGFPLGVELKVNVVNLALSISGRPSNSPFSSSIPFSHSHQQDIADKLDKQNLEGKECGFSLDREEHQKFAKLLESADSSITIDAFLRDNPSMANLGRFYIALDLFSRTYWQDQQGGIPYVSRGILDSKDGNGWYHKLVNILRDGCKTSFDLDSSNMLKILNFNYDRSLEHYLKYDFDRTEVHQGANYKSVVRINHLYGALPMLDLTSDESIGTQLLDAATEHYTSINIIGERATDETVLRARKLINEAHNVFIIGFGFDAENCRQLGFPNTLLKSRIHLHNFNRNSPNFRGIQHLFEDWQREAASVSESVTPPSARDNYRQARDLAKTLDRKRVFWEPIGDAISAGLFRTR